MRRLRTARVFVAGASLVLIGWAAPTAAVATTGDHCVATVVANTSKVTDYRCFDTFPAAISHATKGRVKLQPGARTVSDAQLAAAGVGPAAEEAPVPADWVLGTEYDGTNYGTPSLTMVGHGGSGCAGSTYDFDNLSAYGWNNRPSSALGNGGCWINHYDQTNQGDPHYVCDGTCTGLSSLNNRASSLRFW
ncbi:hypothetical protein [Tenggerimyces flavus]|uniref:Secreted protein n=1 Tax=Tenggerimyces flavus TaxID=1708749 RepID=A0ABV7YIK2_9ACTN|nr:hypothetical protein [Tenggerimyces flavus]MBM7784208.1 hypothetical protein [Tenggerimyces flavus]